MNVPPLILNPASSPLQKGNTFTRADKRREFARKHNLLDGRGDRAGPQQSRRPTPANAGKRARVIGSRPKVGQFIPARESTSLEAGSKTKWRKAASASSCVVTQLAAELEATQGQIDALRETAEEQKLVRKDSETPPDSGERQPDSSSDIKIPEPVLQHLLPSRIERFEHHRYGLWILAPVAASPLFLVGLDLTLLLLLSVFLVGLFMPMIQSWHFRKLEKIELGELGIRGALEHQLTQGGYIYHRSVNMLVQDLLCVGITWLGGPVLVETRVKLGRQMLTNVPEDRNFSQREIKPVKDAVTLDFVLVTTNSYSRAEVSVPDMAQVVGTKMLGEDDDYVAKHAGSMLQRYPQLCIPTWLYSHVHRGNISRIIFEHKMEALNIPGGFLRHVVLSAIACLTGSILAGLASATLLKLISMPIFMNLFPAW